MAFIARFAAYDSRFPDEAEARMRGRMGTLI